MCNKLRPQSYAAYSAAWEFSWTPWPHAPLQHIVPHDAIKRMFSIFCFSSHGTHGVESNFVYYRKISSLASCLLILLQLFSDRICGQLFPASFKSLQALLNPLFFFLFFCFFNRAGTNLMASFGPAHIPGIKPPSPPFFFLCLSFCEQGENKRPAQWSASQLASWIEGPLSWQFMSTPLQKHTYKSHPVLPSWTSDERMMIRMRDGPSFHCVFAPKSITFFHFCHI